MKTTVNKYEFVDAFAKMGREDNFSYLGKMALYDYFEQYEEETGTEIELDIIAICCEYTEYEDFEELQSNYDNIESFEDLENHTQVIRMYDHNDNLLDRFIILAF